MNKKEDVADKTSSAPKTRFWKSKDFWIAIGSVCVALAAIYVKEASHDRALTIEAVTSVDARPDYANGKGIDYRQRFRIRMDEAVLPSEDNGWREILQALGPRALEQSRLASEVPWEEFSTNETSKNWYENYWTPACEKFELDPKTKPTFWDRLDLRIYLAKYGITGKEDKSESNAAPISDPCADYWENGERKEGLVGAQAIEDCYRRLYDGAWTAEEFPTAARWIDENADLYDVYTQAIRKPNFRMQHFIGDEPFSALGILLPDVQYTREIARLLAIRANYRVGKGDFVGASEDYETILLLGKSYLRVNDRTLVENLVGIAEIAIALGIGCDDALNARPTEEDYVCICDVLDEALKTYDSNEISRRAIQGECGVLLLPFIQDVVVERRRKGDFELQRTYDKYFSEQPVERFGLEEQFVKLHSWFAKNSLLIRGGFDDAYFMSEAEKFFDGLSQTVELKNEDVKDVDFDSLLNDSPKKFAKESKLLKESLAIITPAVAPCFEAFRRTECCMKTQRIVLAMLRYQLEHGTLPPAFSVDREGTPLHSWRVLILPYLGEEAKALYEKIRLDEPWDSEYNKQFYAVMPQIYRCPSNARCGTDRTGYSAIVGEGSLFDASGVGKDLNALRSREDVDVRRQALIVERLDPVSWMRPDAELNAQDCMGSLDEIEKARTSNGQGAAAKGVGSLHIGGMNIGYANGSCKFQLSSDPLEPITTGVVDSDAPKPSVVTEEAGTNVESAEE